MQDNLWSFEDTSIGDVDLTGFEVEARDGGIGKVDEATYEVGASHIVVDTGPWIFGKKVLLPAGVVERFDAAEEKVFVSRTKDEIKNAPEYDEDRFDDDRRREFSDYYGGATAEAGAGRGTAGRETL
jgi:hypothetical protein